MTLLPDMPFPLVFNPVKHHRNYFLGLLGHVTAESIAGLLEPLCNNYVDIYTGMLTPQMIGAEVIAILHSRGVLSQAEFRRWISKPKGYQVITLQDGSEWVVRESFDSERYVHIHPARTGSLTRRFKGSTLKTVYLLGCRDKDDPGPLVLKRVNQVRTEAGLSPVKNLERSKGILSCYASIFNREESAGGDFI